MKNNCWLPWPLGKKFATNTPNSIWKLEAWSHSHLQHRSLPKSILHQAVNSSDFTAFNAISQTPWRPTSLTKPLKQSSHAFNSLRNVGTERVQRVRCPGIRDPVPYLGQWGSDIRRDDQTYHCNLQQGRLSKNPKLCFRGGSLLLWVHLGWYLLY